ncbi:MAG: DUF2085 domain-containing protein [Chloroflexi bacterium AL-W]|nr:DUF2085 domain-containing protein [Chloroflexi bacterium AL-N1]NOK65682.1 DUF2085 domain-containing protein [Chloroflexi bacterium AL-N10]NOK74377.1 DUF2085 domain-containing protein [Chloroflexi bacterium AL-N5]NOK80715.1 DUF2085 domain-containing protein [Chloroflexi bacterium AL-W]NOK88635.1 DUF2085 domain-containing protein [Chloroflexi bacterium AL-N15]
MTSTKAPSVWENRVNRIVYWVLARWLWFLSGLLFIYAVVPWLSPLARAAGLDWLGQLLFIIYVPLCHQHADRSFFVYGYQVAFCHRDVAIYTTLFAGGLWFRLVRDWLKPLSWRVGVVLILPMVLDGGSHLLEDLLQIGLRNNNHSVGSLNFWLRMVTGMLFAVAMICLVYPRVDRDLRMAQMPPRSPMVAG